MLPEKILQSDALDILFEHRNKHYGAYVLRREYNNRLLKAILITFIMAVALLVLLSISKNGPVVDPDPGKTVQTLSPPLPAVESRKGTGAAVAHPVVAAKSPHPVAPQ